MSKTTNFENLISEMTDLNDIDFKEAVAISKQFRKAQKRLMRAVARQRRESATRGNQSSRGGLNYEYQ